MDGIKDAPKGNTQPAGGGVDIKLMRKDFIGMINLTLFLSAVKRRLHDEPGFFDAINSEFNLGIKPQEKEKFIEALDGLVYGLESKLFNAFENGDIVDFDS